MKKLLFIATLLLSQATIFGQEAKSPFFSQEKRNLYKKSLGYSDEEINSLEEQEKEKICFRLFRERLQAICRYVDEVDASNEQRLRALKDALAKNNKSITTEENLNKPLLDHKARADAAHKKHLQELDSIEKKMKENGCAEVSQS